MSDRRRAALLAGVTLVLLVAAWRVTPPGSPPLYDGLGNLPADPYRFVSPPPGISHPRPDPFTTTVPVTDGKSPAVAESTDEQPAQAQLLVEGDAFALPPGTTAVTVTITPVAAPAAPPLDGQLDGNVYRFSVAAGATVLQLRATAQATMVLRGPPGYNNVNVERFGDGAWTQLVTTPVGSPDTYAANVTNLGDFALSGTPTSPSPGAPPSSGGGGSSAPIIVGAIGAAALIAAVTALVALRSRQARSPRARRSGNARNRGRAQDRERPPPPRRRPPRR